MPRPWIDARTYRREFEVKKPTVDDLIKAMEKMKAIPAQGYYIFETRWVKPYVTEEDCIKYFADNGSVLVRDSKGSLWNKGERREGE